MRHHIALIALLGAACARTAESPSSTLIANVRIVDGTGAPARVGAVRIFGDTIADVGDLAPGPDDTVIDGGGLTLAPGFIDTHSHHDRGLLTTPEALGAVSQGITTIVAGQDGGHPMPLSQAIDTTQRVRPSINVAFYAGHNSIRSAVMGDDFKRHATPAEIDSMAALLERELGAGALGLATGLEYDPGINSDRSEVIALAKVAAAAGGRYISHIRSEDRWFWDAIDEIIAVGREARLPVQISHIKLAMTPLWGKADSLIGVLDAARTSGIDITADIYPYPYWQSTLQVLFPTRNFDDLAESERVLREIAPADGLLLGDFAARPEYAGKTVAEIAALRDEAPAVTLLSLIKESIAWEKANPGRGGESVVGTSMTEPDIARLMAWEHTNICSDGALSGAHPRGFGTYTRVLGRYVREQKVLQLETAVRKMTSLAAAHVGLTRRGTIARGQFADLVLFDPGTVIDNATPASPHLVSTGIDRVWVNGQLVWSGGSVTAHRPGRVLLRQAQ